MKTEEIVQTPETAITLLDLVGLVAEMLLVRKGEVIDPSLAYERARNIAAALSGLTIET